MRHITLALTISMLWVGATLRAADIPATQPDAPPPAELVKVPTPSTAPAVEQSPAPARVEAGSILVLPFAQTMGANYPWMSLALQQDLQLELSRSSRAKVEAPSAMVATADKNAAVKAGLDSHATLVVYGQYQVTGDQIHISGSVIDVATAKPTGVFAATGSVNNVFPLEDSIAGQVLRELPAGWTTVALPPVNGSGEASGEPAIQPNSPPTVPTIRYYSYTYPTYTA
ncbi:MAG TPA: hypothetical protein VHS31_08700, partial [Tepidisphaeraceae bacterium]|nr:hypothetical protein [Tepidisphaeraceae bacterium]